MAKEDDGLVTKPISGGSVGEADLPSTAGVVLGGRAKTSASPFVEGIRRLRRSTTALIGAVIVGMLLVVAIFADVLAPQSPAIRSTSSSGRAGTIRWAPTSWVATC